MSFYQPEEWIIVKIGGDTPHYRVFGSWRGGYLSGDSWRMNSGIKSVEIEGDYYLFKGQSGSTYRCHKKTYGIRSPYNHAVLTDYEKQGKGKLFKPLIKIPKVMKMDWLI